MTNFDYDLFVIGAGSGGMRASRISSKHGAKVAVCEESQVGGTCVIRGCVPKKLFVYASQYAKEFSLARTYGWDAEEPTFDWTKLVANKDTEINRLNQIHIRNLENHGVKIYHDRGALLSDHEIQVGDQTITAEKILISVGCWPHLPDIPGIDLVKTSNEMFYLEKLPEHICVVGGGYIAVEFAGIFRSLGCKVTQVLRGDKMLRSFDQECAEFLAEEMRAKGIELLFNEPLNSISETNGQRILHLESGRDIQCDEILYATGRKPKIDGLGLEKAGVELNQYGQISVNDQFQTNIPNIYAVGDVIDDLQLTPVALAQGHWLADQLYGTPRPAVNYNNIPTSIFSQPPFSTAGYSEEELQGKYDYDTYVSKFRPMKYSFSDETEKTFMKLLVDRKTDKVLGCHIVGLDSPEMMQAVAVALNCGATKAQFDQTIGIHPTSAEEFVTMREPRKANT